MTHNKPDANITLKFKNDFGCFCRGRYEDVNIF